jgi:hypothetical protein
MQPALRPGTTATAAAAAVATTAAGAAGAPSSTAAAAEPRCQGQNLEPHRGCISLHTPKAPGAVDYAPKDKGGQDWHACTDLRGGIFSRSAS